MKGRELAEEGEGSKLLERQEREGKGSSEERRM